MAGKGKRYAHTRGGGVSKAQKKILALALAYGHVDARGTDPEDRLVDKGLLDRDGDRLTPTSKAHRMLQANTAFRAQVELYRDRE